MTERDIKRDRERQRETEIRDPRSGDKTTVKIELLFLLQDVVARSIERELALRT